MKFLRGNYIIYIRMSLKNQIKIVDNSPEDIQD